MHFRISLTFIVLDRDFAYQPLDGCPVGTIGCEDEGCPNTCFCEDHCSWKKCKLEQPPQKCLSDSNLQWKYDHRKKYWITDLRGIFLNLITSRDIKR